MDFTSELSDFQGALISADNVHPFSNLTYRGGNEEKILYVTNIIQQIIKRPDYVDKLRKHVLYLVLNADFSVLEELVEYEGLEQVIWTVPTIPKCLLCELFWNLRLDVFVYELVAFCSPKLSLQIAEAFITSIKYCTPQSSLQKVKLICSAIYYQMCRLHYIELDRLELLNIVVGSFNCFTKCLNYFVSPPNFEKLERLHKDEKYKHIGNCLLTVFQLIRDCLGHYTRKVTFYPLECLKIYELTQKKDIVIIPELEFTINNSPNATILEYIDKCNTVLLDQCELLVREVSLDIYCAWSEFEDSGETMQQTIGEICFHMRSELQTINVLSEHPLVSMVQEISRQPKQMADLINDADIETIYRNISEGGEHKTKWLHALIERNSTLENITSLNQIISNIDILNDADCCSLLSRLYEHNKSTLEVKDDIKLIMIKLFRKCNLESKCEMLKTHFLNNKFSNTMETSEFSNASTEIFNKLVSVPEAEFTDVLSLFIQNPKETYKKIFEVAVENMHQKNLMLPVIKLLDDFKNHFYNTDMECCVVKITQETLDEVVNSEVKLNNLLHFIRGLKDADTIPASKLLLLVIMPKLHKGLIDKNIPVVLGQCRLLQECYETQELVTYRAPLLAMLAQVLDVARWRIDTFNTVMPPTVQVVINLQKSLFDTYGDNIPVKESVWLKSKIKNAEPLNMFYYRKLWNPPGENFVEVITGKPVHDKMDVEQLVAWLSQILSSTTEQEWLEIWNSLNCFGTSTTLDIFHDALCLITMAQSANHTEKSWACLLHCYRNFVYVVRFKFFKEPLTDEQLLGVLHKVRTIENIIKEENIQDLNTVLLPLFAYIAERKEDFSLDIPAFFESKSKNSKFKSIINKVFVKNA